MENVRNFRNAKFGTTKKRNDLLFEPNYHMTKWFSESMLVNEMKKKNKISNEKSCISRSMNFGYE